VATQPPPGTPPTAQPDALYEWLPDKQINLVRIAYELIGQKGLHRMTLQDVADEAGVSKANVIHHFKSKENLVVATMRWVLGRVAERITAAQPAANDPEEMVRNMIDAIFVDAKLNRNFYLAYTDLIANATRNRRLSELSTTFRTIMNRKYAEVIRAGAGTTFDVDDVEDAAIVVRALIDGLFIQWLEEPRWQQLHGRYRALCGSSVLTYLKGGSARSPAALPE
jgi:TetR/AcrR family fatty acid metabolism transcriptional regulator